MKHPEMKTNDQFLWFQTLKFVKIKLAFVRTFQF